MFLQKLRSLGFPWPELSGRVPAQLLVSLLLLLLLLLLLGPRQAIVGVAVMVPVPARALEDLADDTAESDPADDLAERAPWALGPGVPSDNVFQKVDRVRDGVGHTLDDGADGIGQQVVHRLHGADTHVPKPFRTRRYPRPHH